MKKIIPIMLILFALVWLGNIWLRPDSIVLLDSDLGSILFPVKCDQADGEEQYLKQLRDMTGKPVIYKRIGHSGPTQTGEYYDKYLITSADGSVTVNIYMNFYCPKYIETRPIKGFSLHTPITSTPQKIVRETEANPNTSSNSQNSVPSPTQSDKIPGLDDLPNTTANAQAQSYSPPPSPQPIPPATDHIIPGFDDSPTSSSPSKKSTPTKNKQKMAILPLLQIETNSPNKSNHIDSMPFFFSQTITEAFTDLAIQSPGKLLINQDGHTLQNKNDSIQHLYSICTGTKTDQEKLDAINLLVFSARQIDLIFTGTFSINPQSGTYSIYPIIISKPDNKLFMPQAWEYPRTIAQSDIQADFKAKIIQSVQQQCPLSLTPPPSAPKEVHFAITPLINPTSQQINLKTNIPSDLKDLLLKEVKFSAGKKKLAKIGPDYKLPDAGPTIQKIKMILSNASLSDMEKTQEIIRDIMIPSDIDYLFTALLKEDTQNNLFYLQPWVINKKLGQLFTINLVFQKNELICTETHSQKQSLCQEAANKIKLELRTFLGKALE